MKKLILAGILFIVFLQALSCGSGRNKDVQIAPSQINSQTKQAMAQPQEYIEEQPPNSDARILPQYDLVLLTPIELFHRVNGRMPSTLTEFFNSDFCLVHGREKETGLLFQEAKTLDVSHPENLVYKYIDEDTASLSFILKTKDGEPFIFTYPWNRQKFWGFFPRSADGNDEEMWKQREKTKPPKTTKKAKEILDHFAGMFGWASNDYFIDHGVFPANFDEMFFEKWGVFRHEPWQNFAYDDPVRKLPNKIFGYDKTQDVTYVHSFWEDMEAEYAMKVPANFIDEEGNPLNMREVKDMKSLNIEFFADVESLKNAYK